MLLPQSTNVIAPIPATANIAIPPRLTISPIQPMLRCFIAALALPVGIAAVTDWDGVVSPSTLDAFPRSVLSMAQISRIPERTPGRESAGAERKDVWFVCVKLSKLYQ